MVQIQIVNSILGIAASDWDEISHPDFPFSHYHFLSALETTDCLGARTGWHPQFVLAYQDGQLLGALVQYAKTNGYGEYIFDFAWAEAFQRCGLEYYPKLTSAIPFTPATGPKLLRRTGLSDELNARIAKALLDAAYELSVKEQMSSVHALFIPEDHFEIYRANGYFLRESYQFHWRNEGYSSFAEFTTRLRGKRRREIAREQAQVTQNNIRIQQLSGDELRPEHADQFYEFYMSTIDKRSSFDYLTHAFFREVFRTMSAHLLLVLAFDADDRAIAGALNYFGPQTLYGRHWGCLAEYRALHFEVCYYQGLEFAIRTGRQKFEAGAQGEHKYQRGFRPALTYSAHRIAEPTLDRTIQDFVAREKLQIAQVFKEYRAHDPFLPLEPGREFI